jgi:basic membrane protein A and related proteins
MKELMKKILVVLMIALASSVVIGCSKKTEVVVEDEKATFKMVMVTNVSGLGDEGFNDAAWMGFERAKAELGADIAVIESGEQSQYVPNLQAAAEQGYDLIVAVGFLLVDSVAEAAKQYPDSNFVMIDGIVDAPNVVSVLFKENEAAYLSGIIAGLTTKTNKVGFIGGMETPPVIRFESGWKAGVATVDPAIENTISFVGSFGNPGAGREQATIMYKQGIDIIQGVAGLTEVGIIEAAKDMNTWVIPCDKDKTEMCEGRQLTSSVKKIDSAVMTVVNDTMKGNFSGGVMSLGLKEGTVGFPDTARDVVDPEIMKVVDDIVIRIISGEIIVPSNRDELAAFKAPSI